jgi:hypothetical protein
MLGGGKLKRVCELWGEERSTGAVAPQMKASRAGKPSLNLAGQPEPFSPHALPFQSTASPCPGTHGRSYCHSSHESTATGKLMDKKERDSNP